MVQRHTRHNRVWFLVTVYGSDLQKSALQHMKELTQKASRLRAGRQLDDSVVSELKSLPGYKQLVELMRG